MKYDIEEPHRNPEWYYQAGQSMQKKANYLRLGIYNINRILNDPDRGLSWSAKKDLKHERGILDTALTRIEETFKDRCNLLSGHPDLLQAFRDGYLE